jgi:Flp pilus assembly protein CpaB
VKYPHLIVLGLLMLLGGSLMCAGFVFVGGTIWYGQHRQEEMKKAMYTPLPVPDGKRAVSVRVARNDALSSYVPGMRCDIISTLPDPEDARKSHSEIIIEDVLLLAPINWQDGHFIATLAVTAEQADTLDDAKKRGSIDLAPRRPEE